MCATGSRRSPKTKISAATFCNAAPSANDFHERVDHGRGPPGTATDDVPRGFGRTQRGLAEPRGCQSVEHVEDAHDLRGERNALTGETVGVATAVAPLVMPADDGFDGP